jgi:hypothetical protein
MAAMISFEAPQYPNLQPVIQYALDTPFNVKHLSFSLGSTEAIVENLKLLQIN